MQIIDFIKQYLTKCTATDIATRLRFAVKELLQHNIRCNYDPVTSADNRIILFCSEITDFNKECNGLILDYTTWQPVCRTPAIAGTCTVGDDKKIYYAEDGTAVNLYYYNGRWCAGTLRGIDMLNMTWKGVTYSEALAAVPFTELDTARTYNIVFTHPSMHYTQTAAIWSIAQDGADFDTAVAWAQPQREFAGTVAEAEALCYTIDIAAPIWGFIIRDALVSYKMDSRMMERVRYYVYDANVARVAAAVAVPREDYTLLMSLFTGCPDYEVLFPTRQAARKAAHDEIMAVAERIAAGTPTCGISQYFIPRLHKLNLTNIAHGIMQTNYVRMWYVYLCGREILGTPVPSLVI
jgi:hypothetical protein